MLAKIIGIFWIILGLMWITDPQRLKNRLQRKMSRRMRRMIFFFILIFAFLIIGSVITAKGLLAKAVGIIGMIVAIKAILLLTSKTSEKVVGWWGQRPLGFFRAWGVFLLATGIMLVFVRK